MDQEQIQEIENYEKYYMEFHHKCITWFITIMGFLFVGLLSSNRDVLQLIPNWIPVTITIIYIAFTISFIIVILHYNARIQRLEEYKDPNKNDWKEAHKKVCISFKGKGTWFFLFLIVLFFGLNSILLYYNFG